MDEAFTDDALWNGRLVFRQPAKGVGYRFNIDPVLVAGFAPSARHVVDLGAGVGVIGLLLLAMKKAQYLTAVERQPMMADCMRHNIHVQNVDVRARVIAADLRSADLPLVDLVVFNPPYMPMDAGRGSPNTGRDEARREIYGGLADFCGAAIRCLAPNGAVLAIVPQIREMSLVRAAKDVGLQPVRRCLVRARPDDVPHLIMLQFARENTSPVQSEHLVIHAGRDGRTLSPVVDAWVRGPS